MGWPVKDPGLTLSLFLFAVDQEGDLGFPDWVASPTIYHLASTWGKGLEWTSVTAPYNLKVQHQGRELECQRVRMGECPPIGCGGSQ